MIDRKHEFKKIDTDLFPFHHRATVPGYISRKAGPTGYFAYKGKYGLGYVRFLPNWESTYYCYIEYYIYQQPAKVETPQ